MADIFDKLQPIVERYRAIEDEMAQPEVAADYARLGELNRERSGLEDLVAIDVQYRDLVEERADLRALITEGGDPELVEMAQLELTDVEDRLSVLAQRLRVALLPKDPNDERDVIVEIHAAAGGQEASLFAADLYRMYQRYAQEQGWSVDILDSNPSDLGGFSRIAFSVDGRNAFSKLKFEAGVHRVQRVPETEAQGRIHTSTATVAVLPQADEVEVNIKEDDLRIDIFHAGGHGGQNVNKVATAVRIVHEPTGITVVCQDERSQYKNKSKAMTILRSRLYSAEQERPPGRDLQQPQGPDRQRRPQREDPHLQLPPGPHHRPPNQPVHPRHPAPHGRRPQRDHRPPHRRRPGARPRRHLRLTPKTVRRPYPRHAWRIRPWRKRVRVMWHSGNPPYVR